MTANAIGGHTMRLSRRQIRTLALVLGGFGLLAVVWHFWPPAYDTVRHADRLTVYEGLPHPLYEEEVFREELRTRQTVQLSGFPFYREPLDLKGEDLKTLRGLLGASRTYQSYSGEKKCGGFHPDYAVEWATAGKVYRCLICFGCFEVRIYGPNGSCSYFDLRGEGVMGDRKVRVFDLLKGFRKNRPPHESFGMTPFNAASL